MANKNLEKITKKSWECAAGLNLDFDFYMHDLGAKNLGVFPYGPSRFEQRPDYRSAQHRSRALMHVNGPKEAHCWEVFGVVELSYIEIDSITNPGGFSTVINAKGPEQYMDQIEKVYINPFLAKQDGYIAKTKDVLRAIAPRRRGRSVVSKSSLSSRTDNPSKTKDVLEKTKDVL